MFELSEHGLEPIFNVEEMFLFPTEARSILIDCPGWLLYRSFIRRLRCLCSYLLPATGCSCLAVTTPKSMVWCWGTGVQFLVASLLYIWMSLWRGAGEFLGGRTFVPTFGSNAGALSFRNMIVWASWSSASMLLYWGMVMSEFLVTYGVSLASGACAGYTAMTL